MASGSGANLATIPTGPADSYPPVCQCQRLISLGVEGPPLKNPLTFVFCWKKVLVNNPSGTGGKPQIGKEIGRGAEGIVYENLDKPGTMVKEFHKLGTAPFQARNEFDNLAKGRVVHPDNVVIAQAPADPQQGWIVKEQVIRETPPVDLTERTRILQDFDNAGVQDARGNLIFGHTADNTNPRWILIEIAIASAGLTSDQF